MRVGVTKTAAVMRSPKSQAKGLPERQPVVVHVRASAVVLRDSRVGQAPAALLRDSPVDQGPVVLHLDLQVADFQAVLAAWGQAVELASDHVVDLAALA
jgi:hypothetical protein